MTFKDEIRQAVAQARSKSVDPGNPYAQVLDDVAEALSTDAVVAEVSAAPHSSQRRTLTLYPRFRPAFRSNMLVCLIEKDSVTILSEDRRRLSSREDFEQYLKGFVHSDEFLTSLSEFERQYAAPVEAYLRVYDPRRISRDDVLLIVSTDDQQRLSDAKEDETVELILEPGKLGAGHYKPNVVYQYFNSAGIYLKVESTEANPDGRIRVKGRRTSAVAQASTAYEDMSNEDLREAALKIVRGLRGLASIYRRDKGVLDKAPDEETRRKALHYVATIESLQEYIREQYAAVGVQVRECKHELEKRLQNRMPATSIRDWFRPEDPGTDIDHIADFLETAARIVAPPR